MNRRVVITGMGAVTPVGNDVKSFWKNVQAGVCGIAPITLYDTSGQKVKLAGEVKGDIGDDISPAEKRKMDRFTLLACAAANEALRDSGITPDNADMTRCGVMVSSGIGGLGTIEREQVKGVEKGFDRVSPFFIPMTIVNMAAGRIAIQSGFQGYSASVVTACAGGSNAIGDTFRMIRHGYLDAVLCGGAEGCVTPLAIGGFTSMKALSNAEDIDRASIPFDKERSGFVLGEGAGILMLEELTHAQKRGAKIYAEVTGYGATCDAYHITAPKPNGEGGAEAMRMAIQDAGLMPADIDYINAHGTSTNLNDKGEAAAIHEVFGERAGCIPVSSTKSMTGHLLGAAGAAEAIVCALSVQNDYVHENINYKEPDPECELDIVTGGGRKTTLCHALSNSLGFGGHNAALVISKFEGDK